jgi:hypothetical protein
MLKFQIKVNTCHPLDKSFIVVTNGSPLSFKWKLDFVDGHMKLKGHNPTPPNQPEAFSHEYELPGNPYLASPRNLSSTRQVHKPPLGSHYQ